MVVRAFSFKTLLQVKTVCVYCASSTKIDPIYVEAAKRLGELLAENDMRVVNGAGRMGLMAEVSNAALEKGGKVTGVIPSFMVEQEWQHDGLTELLVVPDMHERKQTMAKLSDAIIASQSEATLQRIILLQKRNRQKHLSSKMLRPQAQ